MLTNVEIIDKVMKMIPTAGLVEVDAFRLGYQTALADKAEEDTQRMREKIDSLKETKI